MSIVDQTNRIPTKPIAPFKHAKSASKTDKKRSKATSVPDKLSFQKPPLHRHLKSSSSLQSEMIQIQASTIQKIESLSHISRERSDEKRTYKVKRNMMKRLKQTSHEYDFSSTVNIKGYHSQNSLSLDQTSMKDFKSATIAEMSCEQSPIVRLKQLGQKILSPVYSVSPNDSDILQKSVYQKLEHIRSKIRQSSSNSRQQGIIYSLTYDLQKIKDELIESETNFMQKQKIEFKFNRIINRYKERGSNKEEIRKDAQEYVDKINKKRDTCQRGLYSSNKKRESSIQKSASVEAPNQITFQGRKSPSMITRKKILSSGNRSNINVFNSIVINTGPQIFNNFQDKTNFIKKNIKIIQKSNKKSQISDAFSENISDIDDELDNKNFTGKLAQNIDMFRYKCFVQKQHRNTNSSQVRSILKSKTSDISKICNEYSDNQTYQNRFKVNLSGETQVLDQSQQEIVLSTDNIEEFNAPKKLPGIMKTMKKNNFFSVVKK